jgi:hypothetical protein
LPDKARAKLDGLTLARDLALDSSRTTNARLQALPQDADPRMRERLTVERDRSAERHRTLQMLVSRINQWHFELRLPPTHRLECQPPYNHVQLAAGQTLAEAIQGVRDQIADVKRQIAEVRAAPLRLESKMESVALYIDGLMRQARPRVGFDLQGRVRVTFTEDLMVDKSSVLALLAWAIGPQELAQAFARDLEQEGDEPENAISPVERKERLDELGEALLRLERRESAWLECDESIVPRSDTDPRAFLHVRVAQAPAAEEPAQVA